MELFRCVVEDNKDPEHLGRVKIRVEGVHTKDLELVALTDMPWSDVLAPLDAGNTLGSSTNILIGTWGYCFNLNSTYTNFLFIGTTKGIFTSKEVEGGFRDPNGKFPVRLNEADNPLTYGKKLEPDITGDRVSRDGFTEEKDTAYLATYPNNKVYEDHNGNIVEIDGTPNNSRIRIQHSTGARVEISNDGDITIQASKDGNIWQETPGLFTVGADGNMVIDCDLKVTGSLETGTTITSGTDITAKGDVADSLGNLSSLRDIYESHGHPYKAGTTPSVSDAPPVDPKERAGDFNWVGTPK